MPIFSLKGGQEWGSASETPLVFLLGQLLEVNTYLRKNVFVRNIELFLPTIKPAESQTRFEDKNVWAPMTRKKIWLKDYIFSERSNDWCFEVITFEIIFEYSFSLFTGSGKNVQLLLILLLCEFSNMPICPIKLVFLASFPWCHYVRINSILCID